MKVTFDTEKGFIAKEGAFGYYVWPRREGFYWCIIGPGPALVEEGRTNTRAEAMEQIQRRFS